MNKKKIYLLIASAILIAGGISGYLFWNKINSNQEILTKARQESKEFKEGIMRRDIVRVLQKDSDLDTLKKYIHGKTAIEFSMTGCHYCEMLEPYFEKALKNRDNGVVGFYHCVDDNEKITRYLINIGTLKEKPDSYPLTIFIDGGKKIGEIYGYQPANEANQKRIEEMLDSLSGN